MIGKHSNILTSKLSFACGSQSSSQIFSVGVGGAIIIAAMPPGSYINFPIRQGHGSGTAAGVP